MKQDGKIKAVVYIEEVNDILRGLKEDLDCYFDVIDSGSIMPRSEGKVTHCQMKAIFGSCVIELIIV